jgi:hypothetical protein
VPPSSVETGTASPLEPPDAAATKPAKKPRRTKHEGYEIVEVHRSQLQNAPYNPRIISDKARDRIRHNIRRVGLLEPLIWNKRTGNIVGGHQRLSIIDGLEGTKDYTLHVAQVDLDEKAEKEQNIALNNTEMQGEWDLEKLDALVRDPTVEIANTGFDVADIYQLFGNDPLTDRADDLMALADKFRGINERHVASHDKLADRDDSNFYSVVVFRSHEDRRAFTAALGLEDNRFVDGRFLIEKLGVDLEASKAALRAVEQAPCTADCDHCGREQPVDPAASEHVCIHCGQPFSLAGDDHSKSDQTPPAVDA